MQIQEAPSTIRETILRLSRRAWAQFTNSISGRCRPWNDFPYALSAKECWSGVFLFYFWAFHKKRIFTFRTLNARSAPRNTKKVRFASTGSACTIRKIDAQTKINYKVMYLNIERAAGERKFWGIRGLSKEKTVVLVLKTGFFAPAARQ